MNALLFRTRVSVIWVAVAVAVSGSLLLGLFEPAALEELLAGQMEGEPLDDGVRVFIAAVVVIPLVMVGVTLLVSDRVNRYLNLIAGLAFGLFGIGGAVLEALGGHLNGHVLMVALAGVFALLIAGLSAGELRQRSSSGTEQGRFREEATA